MIQFDEQAYFSDGWFNHQLDYVNGPAVFVDPQS